MKLRAARTLAKFGAGTMPTSFIMLQAAVRQEYRTDADDTGEQRLAGWAYCHVRRVKGAWKATATVHGSHQGQMWDHIKADVGESACTWIVSIAAREQMAVCGLWDMILQRTASIAGEDPYQERETKATRKRYDRGYVVLESPPTICKFRISGLGKEFIWVDPANYGATDLLDKAQEQCILADPEKPTAKEAWLCEHSLGFQVEQTTEWLYAYLDTLEKLNLGALEQTAASQAMAGFRRCYYKEPITIHDSIPILKLEREAMYGGRCECRFVGTIYGDGMPGPILQDDELPAGWQTTDGRIYHLDVNSLYPAVARDALLPTRLAYACKYVPIDSLLAVVEGSCCIARVLVETETPCVPVRCNLGIIYPVGKFVTTLAGPELSMLLRSGKILKCIDLAVYEQYPIYRRWVKDLYKARIAARESGDHAISNCIKGILNASFGKWAQQARRWVRQDDALPPAAFSQWWETDKETGLMEQWRALAWQVEKLVVIGEANESMPAITATINSLARVRLWDLMLTAGQYNVYYYDTDSLWVNRRGYDSLLSAGKVHDTELGRMRLVDTHAVVTFYNQKRYSADGVLTMAGAPLGSMQHGDAFALTLKAPPLSHYLYKQLPPGTDRHVAKVRLNLPYLVGKVGQNGEVSPLNTLDDMSASLYTVP